MRRVATAGNVVNTNCSDVASDPLRILEGARVHDGQRCLFAIRDRPYLNELVGLSFNDFGRATACCDAVNLLDRKSTIDGEPVSVCHHETEIVLDIGRTTV